MTSSTGYFREMGMIFTFSTCSRLTPFSLNTGKEDNKCIEKRGQGIIP
jgi:hypothetical protein